MPGAYPAPAPTLSGDLETISRFLQSPTQIRRRLRSYVDLRFVSDQILTQRYRSTGGAVLYELTEPFVTDRAVTAVGAGSEYPKANLPTGTGAIAAVSKWGVAIDLTDEEITRNVYAGDAVDRQLRKVVNSTIKQVDTFTMSAVESAITQTAAASTVWSTIATATPFYDIEKAKAVIRGLNLGYNPDTIVMDDTRYAGLLNNAIVANLLRRENIDNPIYTGQIETIAGLRVVVSPNLTVTNSVYVLDSTQIGGMADEIDGAPGYTLDTLGVQVKSIRVDTADKWTLQGRRKTVPVIQEPGAAYKITGC